MSQPVGAFYDELLNLEFLLEPDECVEYRIRGRDLTESLFSDLYLVFGSTVLDEPLAEVVAFLFDSALRFEDLMIEAIEQMCRSGVPTSIADRELDECAKHLEKQIGELRRTAEEGRWQAHYELALQVCRLSRTVRFRFVEPECFDRETKSEILRLLSEAYAAIRADAEATGITCRVKTLDEIKANISYRIDRVTDEADQPVFDAISNDS